MALFPTLELIALSFKLVLYGMLLLSSASSPHTLIMPSYQGCTLPFSTAVSRSFTTVKTSVYLAETIMPDLFIIDMLASLLVRCTDLLQSVTTKGNPLRSHGHEGQPPNREEAYKILYPLGGHPIPSGCMGIDRSEEWDPSNITLYG